MRNGSYYLTTNITVTSGQAIIINPNGVTLDLNGFTISSTSASPSGNGILLATGVSDITILNGHITGGVTYSGGIYSGGGFVNGINYTISQPFNVRVSGVSVSGCGTYGIYLGTDNSTVVDACTVKTVGAYGIEASTVTRSTAYQCGNTAITADIASDCYGYCTGSGIGLNATQTATGCSGQGAGGDGLSAFTANNCYGSSINGDGLAATSASNCYGFSVNGDGINDSQNANNCYGVSSNGYGLFATTAVNCSGLSFSSAAGLHADQTAIGCYGVSASGTALYAFIGNSSYGVLTNRTESEIVINKYNMP